MIKAIFMDYTGTMVQEDEPYTRELVRYFATHSNLKDPGEILRVVWAQIKEIEAGSSGDSITSDIEPAKRLGITPIYISRKEPVSIDGVRVIRSLDEL